MKKIGTRSLGFLLPSLLLAGWLSVTATHASAADDWKGTASHPVARFGALTGFGIFDSSVGWALIGTASGKIMDHGFIPDLDDSLSIEGEYGPVLVQSNTAFFYGVHLRWDFQKDDAWTIYALGGFSGYHTGAALGSRFTFAPRLGIGAMYKVHKIFDLRAEVGHELIVAGISFPFY